jgi:CelD/BcsL family acetyltransferase involved in cellulose biosynthesis
MKTLFTELPDAAAWPSNLGGIATQTHAWTQARAALLPASARQFIGIGDAKQLAAIAPLFRNGDWLREPPLMSEPSDLLWSTPESLQWLANALARQALPVYLERLPTDSPTLTALRRAYARRGLILLAPAMPTPLIELAGKRSDSDALFNSRRRADFRRAERRAAGFGSVAYEIHAPSSESDLAPLLKEAYAVEALSWKGIEGSALAGSTVLGDFFGHFTQAAARQGILRIAMLRIDGQVIAMQIACEWQRRFWLFKIGYDPAFGRCSPGQLLLRHTLAYAAAGGLHSYEFMGLMDDWVKYWTRDVREYVQVRAIPFNRGGLKVLAKRGARTAINRLRRSAR